jgi:capsular polysaccharide export protein
MYSGYIYYLKNLKNIFFKKYFVGWGRKRTGRFALWCHQTFGGTLELQEDGFIRSLGLGVDNYPSFSIVKDDVGIYYDATTPSKLENILNGYEFTQDELSEAQRAIDFIVKNHLSKYNNAPLLKEDYFAKDEKRVLVVDQTVGDASLKYGMLQPFTTDDMIQSALEENPDAKVYIKIHPDVLSGKKNSDINLKNLKENCIIIKENINPISLLKEFSKVYTKTSQMGFEAL